jgi:aspartate kinase
MLTSPLRAYRVSASTLVLWPQEWVRPREKPRIVLVATTDYESVPALAGEEAAPRAGTVVMKFGGTSVGGPERLKAVARRLVDAREAGNRVVAVLSAMGQTTDELIDLAHQMSPRPDPRELDMLQSVGERISCSLAAMAIHDLGHQAISLTGSQAGIVTDTVHGKAKIVDVRARRIHEALDDDRIVLVAGFQGVSTTTFDITTLGRGGSDTTAVALAARLGADACEIYTDVDGVYTADPRIVPEARKLHAVSYDEMLEMAASGAKVLQLRSVEFARNHGVRLHVRSAFSDDEGTWVREEDERMLEKAMISGVTHTSEETLYWVEGAGAATLFEALAGASVNVDTIVQTGPEIVFSAPTPDHPEVAAALDRLGVRYRTRDDLARISVVGAGMKSHPGVAAKAFTTLDGLGIQTEIVTTSPIKISCHVATENVERAVQALHEAFELDRPEAERAHG